MISIPARDAGMALHDDPDSCGGATVLDLALCLILAVTVVGLLLLAL
ncbi:hypothetical protein [Methylobacterium trifolii]|uniref:Uncharacterized protein n=1 Tax=Methylobacterium trifolii TaxID=1003092 RepID=A0ABQ4U3R8_9HYPH|nr:hypothetical protein [Methylobacterium trifolii]GJE61802.1 hypothetical protein MPOCJGCO_3928 [Methylobacterium trifolii]